MSTDQKSEFAFGNPTGGEDGEPEQIEERPRTVFSRDEAAKVLRNGAALIEDDEQVTLAQSIADYIESTESGDGFGRITGKQFFAEIAMAYAEGYLHATGERPREVWTALRAAGLTI